MRLSLLSLTAALTVSIASPSGWPSVSIETELAPQLSPGAEVFLASSPDFGNASIRWSTFANPNYQAYIEPAIEQDVQSIVAFASKYDIPFLAVSGGHGWSSKLHGVHNGIGIATKKLRKMELSPDGTSVRLGGGLKSGEVERFLTAHGKRSLTGVCECTGMLGVALGGGHGTLQGHYGLLADQIIDARVVLADGSVITASEQENQDLFWALRGAGQNFGIVTEYTYKVYEAPAEDNWLVKTLIYTPDKIGAFYEQMNNFTNNGQNWDNQPAGMLLASLYKIVPTFDPTTPVLLFLMVYDGTEEQIQPYLEPFLAVGPAYNDSAVQPYSQISAVFAYDDNSPLCQKGLRSQGYSLLMQDYDIEIQKQTYGLYAEFLKELPEFNSTYLIFETYPQQKVRDISADSTAVAFRDRGIVALFSLLYSGPADDYIATGFGEVVRGLLRKGTGEEDMSVYIGYATGTETVEQIYGRDKCKLAKLKALKEKYDPRRKFQFYAPVV